jgi:hypothetical protein
LSRKLALLIGSTEFEDSKLTQLASPSADVTNLSQILAAREYGQFDDVKSLINKPRDTVFKEMWRFLDGDDKKTDDLVLVYYSGHGILDEMGKLFLACPDTELDLLRPTALAATDLNEALDRCRSRRQVLILDCCNSGSFKRGSKGVLGASVGIKTSLGADPAAFGGEGQGRVVLTATDETQYAMEGDIIAGNAQPSVFTRHLLEGLQTGEADQNGDGWIGIDELYDYVNRQVLNENPTQRPKKFADVRGEFVIARRPRGTEKPVPLTAELIEGLRSPARTTRLDAVTELADWLEGSHLGKILAAYAALQRVATEDDSVIVQNAAKAALEGHQNEYERALAEQTERITVLHTPQRSRRDEMTRPERQSVEPSPPAPPAPPIPPQIPESSRDAWQAWAMTETNRNVDLARIAADAALAALSRGASSEAAVSAARRAITRARQRDLAVTQTYDRTPKHGLWVGGVTVIALVLFGTAPLALITVWLTRWSTGAKVIVAVVAGVESLVLLYSLSGLGR